MPTISIIIPAYRAAATVFEVLAEAVAQAGAVGADLIVVESSGDGTAGRISERWPSIDVVTLPERTLPGRARNLGAKRSEADLLVFLDADAVPAPGWLERLLAALSPHHVAVAGAIGNGTPGSVVGTSGWLLEFSDWLPGHDRVPGHAASASLLVRREAFLDAGGFPEDIWPGEDTVLTYAWGVAGRLAFASDAVVHHRNRTAVREFLTHQHRLGVAFQQICARVDFDHGGFGRRPWSAFGGALRLAALARRLRASPTERRLALTHAPSILLGLGAWTAGVWRAGRRA